MRFRVIIGLLLFWAHSGMAGGPPLAISEDVYVGEAKAPSGAIVHFGMERLDEASAQKWKAYVEQTAKWADTSGAFYILAKNSATENQPVYDAKDSSHLGFTKQEYEDFIHRLQKAQLYAPEKLKAIARLDGGTKGFLEKVAPGRWVVYASRTKVVGKFHFDPKLSEKKELTLKDFQKAFHNLLMCMTVTDFPDTPYTEHRGIFRNMFDFADAEKEYAGIAMILHGFAADVALRYFRNKMYMEVDATPFMSTTLKKSIKPGDMFIGSNKHHFPGKYQPLIYEVTDDQYNIAKEGVDVRLFEGGLPAPDVQYYGRKGDGLLRGVLVHLVKLKVLAQFYEQ